MPDQNYALKFNPRLGSQLRAHANFIANVSLAAASRFRGAYLDVVKDIAANPFMFPAVDAGEAPDPAYRKAVFAKWYILYFTVEEAAVYIDAVVDGRSVC